MLRKAAIITAFDPYLFRGGIETYTLQLLALLNEKEIEVTLYHTGCRGNKGTTEPPQLANTFLNDIYQAGRQLFREEKRYDFIIANSFYGMGYFPPSRRTFTIYHSVYGGFTEQYRKVHSEDPSSYFTWLCEEMGEYVSGYGRIRVAVSDSVREELESVYGFKEVKRVFHGIDTSVFRKGEEDRRRLRRKFGIPENAFVGMFVGGWEAEKRNDVMRRVIARRPDLHWLLILARRGVECDVKGLPNVSVMEEIRHSDMPLMYALADFMLFPSAYEGFGMVIIEAMSCGIPVLTTNVGVARSIYTEQPFRRLLLHDIARCDEKDLAVIDEKITMLREDQKFRREVVREGITVVRERFSLERWKNEMETVLDI